MNDKHPYMDYLQYRAACRLVHECCISYSLLCRWFIAAVLPLDGKLEAALLHRADRKRCTECGGYFLSKSNRGKYCPDCTVKVRRRKESERQRKRYRLSTHLGYERSP